MYCSNCGTAAEGKFCSQCGHQLHRPEPRAPEQLPAVPAPPATRDPHAPIFEIVPPSSPEPVFDADDLIVSDPPSDSGEWEHEINYKHLIRHPDVRDLLAMAGNRSKSPVSSEEILDKFEKVVPGVSIAAKIAQPLYSTLGVKTGKTATRQFDLPAGKVLVSILCALTEGSSKLRNVHQLQNGCCIEASIPSDILSFEGIVTIQVTRRGPRTTVEAATNIPGQWFDFGKSQRFLDHLLGNIRHAA